MKFFIADLVAVLVFAILARIAHSGLEITQILDTYWPFALGTAIAWIFVRNRVATAMNTGAIVWITTVVCGLGIWGVRHGEFPHWSFIMVASIMSALLLFGWRFIYNKTAKNKQ